MVRMPPLRMHIVIRVTPSLMLDEGTSLFQLSTTRKLPTTKIAVTNKTSPMITKRGRIGSLLYIYWFIPRYHRQRGCRERSGESPEAFFGCEMTITIPNEGNIVLWLADKSLLAEAILGYASRHIQRHY